MEERSLKEKIKQIYLELRETQRLMKEWRDEHVVVFKVGAKPPPLPAKLLTPQAFKRLRELEEQEEELLQQLEDLYKSR